MPDTNSQPNNGQQNEERLIDTILSKTSESDLKSILGPSPLQKFGKKSRLSAPRFNPGWGLVKSCLLLGFFTFLYFYIQLSLSTDWLTKIFGDNYLTVQANSETELMNVNTNINKHNYLLAKFNLDQFVYLADSYNYKQNQLNSRFNNPQSKKELASEVQTLDSQMQTALSLVKDKIMAPLALNPDSEEAYKVALVQQVQTDKRNLLAELAKASDLSKTELRQEQQSLDTVIALLHAQELKGILQEIDLSNLDTAKVNKLLRLANKIAKNDFSIVSQIKDNRVRWAGVINDIVRITQSVDALYGHGALGNLEEITYSSFNFDADTQKITVNGETKRDDTKNFTLLANLIDAFEGSPQFKEVEGRTFTKNRSTNEEGSSTTTAPLRLTFVRQNEPDAKDKTEGLEEQEKQL